jgi:hypothetical protein
LYRSPPSEFQLWGVLIHHDNRTSPGAAATLPQVSVVRVGFFKPPWLVLAAAMRVIAFGGGPVAFPAIVIASIAVLHAFPAGAPRSIALATALPAGRAPSPQR